MMREQRRQRRHNEQRLALLEAQMARPNLSELTRATLERRIAAQQCQLREDEAALARRDAVTHLPPHVVAGSPTDTAATSRPRARALFTAHATPLSGGTRGGVVDDLVVYVETGRWPRKDTQRRCRQDRRGARPDAASKSASSERTPQRALSAAPRTPPARSNPPRHAGSGGSAGEQAPPTPPSDEQQQRDMLGHWIPYVCWNLPEQRAALALDHHPHSSSHQRGATSAAPRSPRGPRTPAAASPTPVSARRHLAKSPRPSQLGPATSPARSYLSSRSSEPAVRGARGGASNDVHVSALVVAVELPGARSPRSSPFYKAAAHR